MKHVLNILAFNTCFNGSDVDENRHFIQGEVVAHRQILLNGNHILKTPDSTNRPKKKTIRAEAPAGGLCRTASRALSSLA